MIRPFFNWTAFAGIQFPNASSFTRSTTASYCNKQGYISYAPIGVLRDDWHPTTGEYLGKLIEGVGSTNFLTYSSTFSNAAWSINSLNAFVVDGSIVSPDGNLNFYKMSETAVTSGHSTYRSISGLTANTAQTFSVFVKAGERSKGRITITNAAYTDSVYADFDLVAETNVAGSIGAGTNAIAGIKKYKNGWFRVSITGTS